MRLHHLVASLVTAGCIATCLLGQASYTNPWEPTELGVIPPIASLSEGVWLKGDLHTHSRHSKDSSNNSEAKIITFAESVGMGYLCISGHDNHVNGDTAHNTWNDPEFKSNSVLLLYCAEWTTTRGHGTALAAPPYDHQRLYDVRDQRDVVIGAVKKELGIHLSANHPSGKDYFGFSYDMVDSVEVWNSAVWPKNANAIMIWYDMLSSGRKITGRRAAIRITAHPILPNRPRRTPISGMRTMLERPPPGSSQSSRTHRLLSMHSPTDVSPSALIRMGHAWNYADLDQDGKMDMMMGDNAKSTGKPVKFRVQFTGTTVQDASYTVSIVKNGDPFTTVQAIGKIHTAEFTDTPEKTGRTYYRVGVTGPSTAFPEVPGSMTLSGNMVGLSNPLYFNFEPNYEVSVSSVPFCECV